MGYACPVCEDPQSDAGHLANHLAFTAITHGGDHEDWLDEHVPGWGQLGEAELAEEVAGHAEETEFPQVFEESGLEESHDHDHPHGHGGHQHGAGGQGLDDHGLDPSAARSRGAGDLDEEAQKIMAEARELTEEIRDEDNEGAGDDGESDGTGESDENAEADAEGESEGETE